MPQLAANRRKPEAKARGRQSKLARQRKAGVRYTVGLPSTLAVQVEKYAETVDVSMSKAIASLVRIGLDSQADRKREFFEKMRANLAKDDPQEEDRLVNEFRALILGR